MSAFSNFGTIETSLPVNGVPATGQFTPVLNVVPNTFNTSTGASDTPYNTIYIGDASSNIVGSTTTPYLPVALPAYIPTLYENMYYVQNNLKNTIPTADVSNNREYPTIYAVKQYVATQLQGSELLIPVVGVTEAISTGFTTSFLEASQLPDSPNVDVLTDISNNVVTYVTTFSIKPIDSARSGAEKVCISTTPLGIVATNAQTGTKTNQLLQIVLDDSQLFIVNGKAYRSYAFSNLGDTLNMFQFINPNPQPGNPAQLFFVLSYGGLFSVEQYYKTSP